MDKNALYNLVAPCGINCGECECYKSKDNEKLYDYLISKGMNKDKIPCPGCRDILGNCPALGSVCDTYLCVEERGVKFCYECSEFPCGKLLPAADRADILPHNIKVFCLCTIKNFGLDKFIEDYPQIKEKYYKGKMTVGAGPKLQEKE